MNLQEILKQVEKINRELHKKYNLSRPTDYEYSGVLKQDGTAITTDEFFTKYGRKAQDKMEYLNKLISPDYQAEKVERFRQALLDTANATGDREMAELLNIVKQDEFIEMYYNNKFDKIIITYEETKEGRATSKLGGNINAEIIGVEQLGDEELPY